jgi:integrase
MDKREVENDKVFQEYIEERHLKPSTIKTYLYHLYNYCQSTKLLPSELLEEAEEEEKKLIILRKRKIKQHLKSFENFMDQKEFSHAHQQTARTVIKTFYRHFEIQLPQTIRNRTPQSQETYEDLPTIEELSKALSLCYGKYKPIFLTMLSSSMGGSEVRNLKVKDFLNAISDYFREPLELPLDITKIRSKVNKKVFIGEWNIIRVKTSMPYTCFTSPEANFSILEYMEREPPKSVDDYLFPRNIEQRNEPIKENTFMVYFQNLNNRTGLGKVNNYVKLHSHVFRKFYASKLLDKDIQQIHIDALLGHSVSNKTTGAYFKPTVQHLKHDYLKIVKDISIEEIEVKTMESPEYQELKEQYQRDSITKDEEMVKMGKRLEIMEELLRNKEFTQDINE